MIRSRLIDRMCDVHVCKNGAEGHDRASKKKCNDNREETVDNATLILDETQDKSLKIR
jgi:hypothetical protein